MGLFRGDVVGFFRFTFANGDEDDLRDPGFVIREEAAAVRWNGMVGAGQIQRVARLTF
jgi:hypothetical protein